MWIRYVHTIRHMVSAYRKGMTNFHSFLLISFSTDIFTSVLHLFCLFVYLSVVFFLYGFVLLPHLTHCEISYTLLSAINSWYFCSYLIPFLSGPRTNTWLCFLYLLLLCSFHTWLTSSTRLTYSHAYVVYTLSHFAFEKEPARFKTLSPWTFILKNIRTTSDMIRCSWVPVYFSEYGYEYRKMYWNAIMSISTLFHEYYNSAFNVFWDCIHWK